MIDLNALDFIVFIVQLLLLIDGTQYKQCV